MNMNKIKNKLPKELTTEELLELTNQITLMEYQKRPDIQQIQSAEDATQEILTYMYEKSSRGKTGIKELQEKSTMAHFINILHFECRNSINYIIRKKNIQNHLYNTDSFDMDICQNEDKSSTKTLKDIIPDKHDGFNEVHLSVELQEVLSRIDDTANTDILIKYDDKNEKCFFSYRKLAKVYFDRFSGRKLSYKDMQDVLYDKNNEALNDIQIKTIMTDFRQYLKNYRIFGGII